MKHSKVNKEIIERLNFMDMYDVSYAYQELIKANIKLKREITKLKKQLVTMESSLEKG